ncbi:unnamed protein product [Paramecium sonneborni]|uniref:Protein kinase domain-containing protein n=1 Tax=Paramecium sonneborni TaxID=65129 RepID=A0A8S1R4F7_9CILI|nr:unnamed protein product [Paramecium sonneborni]
MMILSFQRMVNIIEWIQRDEFDLILRPFSQYEIMKQLGEGSFGCVTLMKHRITDDFVAIKIIKMIGNAQDIEIQVLRFLSHKNIVKVFNSYALKNTEMGKQKGGRLSEENVWNIFQIDSICNMILSHKNLVYRDLKLQNLLFTHQIQMNQCSTNQICRQNIWSMGIRLYKMLFGNIPFNGKTHQDIINKELKFPSNNLNEVVIMLLNQNLKKKNQLRLRITNVEYHSQVNTKQRTPQQKQMFLQLPSDGNLRKTRDHLLIQEQETNHQILREFLQHIQIINIHNQQINIKILCQNQQQEEEKNTFSWISLLCYLHHSTFELELQICSFTVHSNLIIYGGRLWCIFICSILNISSIYYLNNSKHVIFVSCTYTFTYECLYLLIICHTLNLFREKAFQGLIICYAIGNYLELAQVFFNLNFLKYLLSILIISLLVIRLKCRQLPQTNYFIVIKHLYTMRMAIIQSIVFLFVILIVINLQTFIAMVTSSLTKYIVLISFPIIYLSFFQYQSLTNEGIFIINIILSLLLYFDQLVIFCIAAAIIPIIFVLQFAILFYVFREIDSKISRTHKYLNYDAIVLIHYIILKNSYAYYDSYAQHKNIIYFLSAFISLFIFIRDKNIYKAFINKQNYYNNNTYDQFESPRNDDTVF